MLLHAAVIAMALISFKPRQGPEQSAQTPVSIVVENSGAKVVTAPPEPRQGPPTLTQAPPAPATAPPAPAPQPQQPEMSLQIPPDLFSEYNLPPASPQQQEQTPNRRPPHPQRRTHRQYQVMNNMSYGNAASGTAAPQPPHAFPHGLNLRLSQSDLNALNRPEISVQGNIGSDWMDEFNKWVNDRIYYPKAAVEQNQQGTSVISFTVNRDGSVTNLKLVSSAGSTFLDQAWLDIFKDKVPPFPPGSKSSTIKITASLEYELIGPGEQ